MGSTKSSGEKFYGWAATAVAALVFFIVSGLVIFPFGVFLPSICEAFSWSRVVVSGALTVLLAMMGLVAPLAAGFISKYGARRAIIFGNLLAAVGLFFLAYHSAVWQLYILYGGFTGVGLGFGGLLATTTIANNWFVKKRTLALGIIVAASGVGGMVLVPAVQMVITWAGWRSAYLFSAAAMLVFGVIIPGVLIRNKPEDLGQQPDGPRAVTPSVPVPETGAKKLYQTPVDFTLKEAMQTRALWLVIALFAGFTFAMSMVMAHQIAFLTDLGIGAGISASILGLRAGAGTVGKLGAGFLGLRFNVRPLIVVTMVLMTIGMTLIFFAGYLPVAFTHALILGIGYGGVGVAVTGLMPAYFGSGHYPEIFGFSLPFTTVLGALGALVAGGIYDLPGSYVPAFSFAVAVLLAGLVCILLARPPRHPSLVTSERENLFGKSPMQSDL